MTIKIAIFNNDVKETKRPAIYFNPADEGLLLIVDYTGKYTDQAIGTELFLVRALSFVPRELIESLANDEVLERMLITLKGAYSDVGDGKIHVGRYKGLKKNSFENIADYLSTSLSDLLAATTAF